MSRTALRRSPCSTPCQIALPWRALNFDLSGTCLHNVVRDPQAESEAAEFMRLRGAFEFLKDLPLMILIDANAVIAAYLLSGWVAWPQTKSRSSPLRERPGEAPASSNTKGRPSFVASNSSPDPLIATKPFLIPKYTRSDRPSRLG